MTKKILMISGSLHQIPAPPKGTAIAQLIEDIAEGLKGYNVQVVSYKKEDFINRDRDRFIQIDPNSFRFKFYLWVASIIPHRINKKLWGRDNPKFIAYFLCIVPLLRKLKPDIIITSVHLDGFILFCKRYRHAKHIFHFHSSNIELEGEKKLRFLAKHADYVFTLTHESSDHLKNKFGMSPNKVHPLPNAINLGVFNSREAFSLRLSYRDYFGLGESDFVLGYAGRLTLSKGLDQILECLIKLQEKYKNIKLLIAGSQENDTIPDLTYHDRIESLLQKVEPGRIVFTGWLDREKMINFYSCIDVGLLLSKQREGHSMFGLECQACAVPVIATTIGGNPEIIVHNKSGFLLSKGKEAEELEFYILQLYNDTRLLHTMQIQAVENIKTNFTYDLLLSRITKVLKAL